MAESPVSDLPHWVRKRDGSLEPFNVDKLSAALFAASESLGAANAFLARELTEGIVFFLAQEKLGDVAEAEQIAELAVKVVREFGHPQLAQAFADGNARRSIAANSAKPERTIDLHIPLAARPQQVAAECLAQYSLAAVFSRDIAAAHRDGLLTLSDLQAPRNLLGRICDLGDRASQCTSTAELADICWRAISKSGRDASSYVVVEDLDWLLARTRASSPEIVGVLAQIADAAADAGLTVIVPVNSARPSWAAGDSGPLFVEASATPEDIGGTLQNLARLISAGDVPENLRIDWHLRQTDFDTPNQPSILTSSEAGAETFSPRWNIAVVFDRPRKAAALGENIERNHPAVLLAVGLNLMQLAEQPGVAESGLFLEKLGTLAQMAVSAAVQKRRYLREQHPALNHGFLLDRARLVGVPFGLHDVARRLTENGPDAIDLARQILAALTTHLQRAGTAVNLDVVLDCGRLAFPAHLPLLPGATLKEQLRVAGTLHGTGGTALLRVEAGCSVHEVMQSIRYAWQKTDLGRLLFTSASP